MAFRIRELSTHSFVINRCRHPIAERSMKAWRWSDRLVMKVGALHQSCRASRCSSAHVLVAALQDDMEQTTHLLDRSHEQAAVIWAT